MTKVIKGQLKGRGIRIGIVAAKFNEFITQRLLDGCLDELAKLGVANKDITVVWVPGSFDIPVLALTLAKKRTIDAVICLGVVIRGETYHFELVAQGAAQGISAAALQSGKPVILGVLSTETVDQAYKRSDKKKDNKGRDAAVSAVEMVSTLSQLK